MVVLLARRSRVVCFDPLLPGLAAEPENRLSAIVDSTFNLGAGRLQTSTLRRRVNGMPQRVSQGDGCMAAGRCPQAWCQSEQRLNWY